MKNIELKNIIKLFKFDLYINRKYIAGWSVAIFSVMTLYMILFSSVQEMAQVKFDMMPKELLQFVGMDDMSSMSDYTTYYGMIFSLVLVAISVFAATFSAKLITNEEKTKSIEFLISLSVSREEIYIAKFVTSVISIVIIVACAVISAIVCGIINGGETFSLAKIVLSAKVSGFSPFLFGGIAIMLAGINPKLGSGAIASSVVFASYMLGYLGELLGANGELLTYFSPFITLNVKNVIASSPNVITGIAIYFLVYVVAIVVGCIAYKKRDLQV